jgi:E3 SUMO-protein ligase PIAS1
MILQNRAKMLLSSNIPALQLKINELRESQKAEQAGCLVPMLQQQQQCPQPQQSSTLYEEAVYNGQGAQRQMHTARGIDPNNQSKPSPTASAASSYTVHGDVRLKRLSYFDLMGELLKPSSLVPHDTWVISLQLISKVATTRTIRACEPSKGMYKLPSGFQQEPQMFKKTKLQSRNIL